MPDVDSFSLIESVALPASDTYRVEGLDRGDHLANRSPTEALPSLVAAGRTPLTLEEGMHWLLQQPEVLERGRRCTTIGSRRRRPDGSLDTRTPALWISSGTGRDGRADRDAPNVGWCRAGNRPTWWGFASTATRTTLPNCSVPSARAVADVAAGAGRPRAAQDAVLTTGRRVLGAVTVLPADERDSSVIPGEPTVGPGNPGAVRRPRPRP